MMVGWGQEEELPQSAGSLPHPQLGDAREREEMDGPQDPTLKLAGAGARSEEQQQARGNGGHGHR